jgi:hypothetical protein
MLAGGAVCFFLLNRGRLREAVTPSCGWNLALLRDAVTPPCGWRPVFKWTGIVLAFTVLLPLALIALMAYASAQSPKTGTQLKTTWTPDGAPTSRKDAEWRAGFGRGTPQNLWGVYKAPNGQIQMEQAGTAWYLGDDEAWHPLDTPPVAPGARYAGMYS